MTHDVVLVLTCCGSHCCSVPGDQDVEELCFVVMGPKISGHRAALYDSHQRSHTPSLPRFVWTRGGE